MSNSVACHRTRRLQLLNAARGQRDAGSSQRPLLVAPQGRWHTDPVKHQDQPSTRPKRASHLRRLVGVAVC